jgi:hypothetical protein
MIGRIAHSVRLLLRIGEMTVPSILGRRGCAPVIGPSDEGPKCRVCRAYRDSSRECVPRACCTSATCSGLRSSCHRIRRTRARFYTIIHRKSASFAALAGPVAVLWSPRGHRVSTISPRRTSMPFKLSLTATRSSCGSGTLRTNVLPCALASDGTIARHPSPRRSRTRGTMPIHSTT